MKVLLIDGGENEFVAEIVKANLKDLEKIKKWNFNWLELRSRQSVIYKLQKNEEIIGLVKLKWENEEHFILANIEISPSNIGSKGQYRNAAELLFAYSALMSFKLNTANYKGFLAFISKGRLIKHYVEKYKAELVFRERMIISPDNCRILIKQQLKIEL